MKNVIIIGAGGHGAELDEYIQFSQKCSGIKTLKVVGFLDDNPANYASYHFSAPLMGGVREHKVVPDGFYIIGIANLAYRRFFVELFLSQGARFLTFVHSTAYVSESATIGQGSIIGPYVNVGPNAQVGNFTLINSRCSLGHDTVIGDFDFISPNVCFSGFSSVGNDNLFGINSSTIPHIRVGNRNKIAAGMVLDHHVPDDSVVFYRFKEKVIAMPAESHNKQIS
ncbi:acetyltransferase [Geofilum rubicundum]|uniref:4-amino-6-deoxy-N-acetyl-D-hexosaminyl-acetyltrasferase n=1 Tax=Geofilum rubicundum JCM 15548 TaxID=1236989 RepID=A0A0E9M2B8_9BACT|nr:acetyltransferase [Geofilum rubicundum]GAO31664.1 4-amino-6-deoxy-N-acetyl-D-hexosaminyl-acetyltrasferase [Geofilum rubicundum JCM 15548]